MEIIKPDEIKCIYEINETEMEAEIASCVSTNPDLIIPRSTYYKSKEYNIIRINSRAFGSSTNIKSIQFSPDSKLQIIEGEAFKSSSIESISLPPEVTHIREEAFSECEQLRRVEIPTNSKLQQIGALAFNKTSIESIFVPSHVKKIGTGAFHGCEKLKRIEFSADSELQIIEKYAFSHSSIESISIPIHVTKICEGAFVNCHNLQRIEFPVDSELQIIEKYAFLLSSIKIISIPSHLKIICEKTFSHSRIIQIEIPENSELETIEKKAFRIAIKSIFIPKNLINLEPGWCESMPQLNKIKVDPKNPRYLFLDEKYLIGKSNKLTDEYDSLIFARRDIVEAKIPSFIKYIGPYSFEKCYFLKKVEFSTDSELQIIDEFAFSYSSIVNIKIPPKLIDIKKGCFYCISHSSQLKITIDENNKNFISYNNNDFIYSILLSPNVTFLW